MTNNAIFPPMRIIQQNYNVPLAVDVETEIDKEWASIKDTIQLRPSASIAVGVGSRGIQNLVSIVRAVVRKLSEAGYRPFIIPAMGSHGGATATGQIEVLQARGITEESVHAPIRATMAVVRKGEIDGMPLFLNRLAEEADGIVLINRIKPHTNFIGATESGLIKMMAIGLGNQIGAEHYHRLSVVKDYYTIISSAGRELLKRTAFLFGVGLVENHDHDTAAIRFIPGKDVEKVETELLIMARSCMPTIPLDELDLLIVDEMGKDISGEGIDPNVVGRDVCALGVRRPKPKISRIFIRDLSEGSEGSAVGVGQADFTTQRLVNKIDFKVTAINCLTCCGPECGRIPLYYPNDREALEAALMTLRPYTLEDLRLVWIRNTLQLKRLVVSEGCLPDLAMRLDIEIASTQLALEFDAQNNLISPIII